MTAFLPDLSRDRLHRKYLMSLTVCGCMSEFEYCQRDFCAENIAVMGFRGVTKMSLPWLFLFFVPAIVISENRTGFLSGIVHLMKDANAQTVWTTTCWHPSKHATIQCQRV